MKTNFLCAVLLLLATSTFSQTSDNSETNFKPYSEIGVNPAYLIEGLLDLQFPLDPYFVTYRRNYAQSAFRVGLDFDYDSFREEPDLPYSVSRGIQTRLRLGHEWQQNFGRRWQLFYGVDAHLAAARSVRENFAEPNNSTSKATQLSFGAGPLLGLKFKLNERLMLATETNYLGEFRLSTRRNSIEGTNPNSTSETDESFRTRYNYPSTIFLLIRL